MPSRRESGRKPAGLWDEQAWQQVQSTLELAGSLTIKNRLLSAVIAGGAGFGLGFWLSLDRAADYAWPIGAATGVIAFFLGLMFTVKP